MMDKVIFFNRDEAASSGQVFFDFLDYAFSKTNYFGLVYINYKNKGYRKLQKYFLKSLEKFKIKSRNNPGWPRTYEIVPDSNLKIVFYKTEPKAKEILKEAESLYNLSGINPCNLCFFKGNQCWFFSIGNENIAAIIHASDEDINFLESKGLALKKDAFIPKDNRFDEYDENING